MRTIDNREFVVAYVNSESLDEVAKTFDLTKVQASAKAQYLRKKGVKLPKLKRGLTGIALEVTQLNSLINKHLGKRKKEL